MPNATEITRMRQTAQKRLPDAATIARMVGGSLQTISSNVPCRLSISKETDLGNPLVIRSEVKITLPALADVRLNDQITINGQTFTVAIAVVAKSDEITRNVEANTQ